MFFPAPELTEAEAELSRCLHTYSRKCMDSLFSCVLHQAINDNRGKAVWYTFLKNLKPKVKGYNIPEAIEAAHSVHDADNSFDNLLMCMILVEWSKNHQLKEAIED